MRKEFFVSAYATSPSFNVWNSNVEQDYFRQLSEHPNIIGLEHPFLINSDRYKLPWLKDNVPEHWSIAITMLPIFMNNEYNDPHLGLASTNEISRQKAVQIMQQASFYVQKINDLFGRKVVNKIHFHSAPSNKGSIKGCILSLEKSLNEIKCFDWDGADLNLEHCDSYLGKYIGDKCFLSLGDEIDALIKVGGYGIVLNWARSAIEGYSTLIPLDHIRIAQQNKLLKGFFFSGCTDKDNSDYGKWKDTHMPSNNIVKNNYLMNDSLLGKTEIDGVLKLLNHDVYMGVKTLNPDNIKRIDKSLGLNIGTIEAINSCIDNVYNINMKNLTC